MVKHLLVQVLVVQEQQELAVDLQRFQLLQVQVEVVDLNLTLILQPQLVDLEVVLLVEELEGDGGGERERGVCQRRLGLALDWLADVCIDVPGSPCNRAPSSPFLRVGCGWRRRGPCTRRPPS